MFKGLGDCHYYKWLLPKGRKQVKNKNPLGEQVLSQMSEEYFRKWHHAVFSTFFMFSRLVKTFLERKTFLWNCLSSNGKLFQ
jgi:hypothetical protein